MVFSILSLLHVESSQFIENAAISGNAIYAVSSIVEVFGTTFLGNYGNESFFFHLTQDQLELFM